MPNQENPTAKGSKDIKGSLNNSGTIIMNNININNHIVNNTNENNGDNSTKDDNKSIPSKAKKIQMIPPSTIYMNSPIQPQPNNLLMCNSTKGHQSLSINSKSPHGSNNNTTLSKTNQDVDIFRRRYKNIQI